MLTVVLASVAAAASRNRMVGVLRILGMSAAPDPRAGRVGARPGRGRRRCSSARRSGSPLPYLVTAVLDLRAFVGGHSPPRPAIDPLWIARAVAVFIVVVVIAGLRRQRPSGVASHPPEPSRWEKNDRYRSNAPTW